MDPKLKQAMCSVLSSKTLWVALAGALAGALQMKYGWVISPEVQATLVVPALMAFLRAVTSEPLTRKKAPGPMNPPAGGLAALLVCGLLLGSCSTLTGANTGTVLRVVSWACQLFAGVERVKEQVDRAGFDAACAKVAESAVVACADIDEGDGVEMLFVAGGGCEACIRPEP